eukprot:TRINITY_DN8251_c0_g1_i1.p1 TRINITY_DN8251_c0_g1~~TRINITY_DN8251_c0_g1_i1.p1  ORF type:complete len:943 (+),score=381.85 TRINITY_DN8251_c0_g1_i1:31-2859(+)
MWVSPQQIDNSCKWEIIISNEYFETLKKIRIPQLKLSKIMTLFKAPTIEPCNSDFQIVMKNQERFVIAIADSLEGISIHWRWIEQNILPLVEHSSKDEDIFLFCQIKFEVLSRLDPSDLEVELQHTFTMLFDIPNEKPIDVFDCSLWKKYNRFGQLFVTKSFLCFNPVSSNDSKFTIPMQDIVTISKATSHFGVSNNAIRILTKQQEFFFASFKKRDRVCELLEQLFQQSLERALEATDLIRVGSPKGSGSYISKLSPQSTNNSNHVSDLEEGEQLDIPPNLIKASEIEVASLTVPKVIKREKSLASNFNSLFRLPSNESLVFEIPCSMLLRSTSFKGKLYISLNFVCFRSHTNRRSEFSVILAFREIQKIVKDKTSVDPNSVFDSDETIILVAKRRRYCFLTGEPEFVFKSIYGLWEERLIEGQIQPDNFNMGIECICAELLNDRRNFSANYAEQQRYQRKLWKAYSDRYGSGSCMLEVNPELRDLIRAGIPDELRGNLWQYFSGAFAKSCTVPNGYYQNLLTRFSMQESTATHEIEKDLGRSFPDHPFYQSEAGIQSLRSVLTAYSWRNEKVGYCQSLNIVCALFLLFMSQQSAFWTLSALCEEIVPDHYTKHLIGSIVDQRVLNQLLSQHLPAVYKHFEVVQVPLGMLAQPWFLCLFIGSLPMETTLNILDCFFYEGSVIIFSVALGILKLLSDLILAQQDAEGVIDIVRDRNNIQSNKLLNAAFKFVEKIPASQLQELRLAHRIQVIREAEDFAKWGKLRELQELTKFSEEELDLLYLRFMSVVGSSGKPALEFPLFCNLCGDIFSFWHDRKDILVAFFAAIKNPQTNLIDFGDLVIALSCIYKGTLAERFEFCFKINSTIENPNLDQGDFYKTLDALIRIETKTDITAIRLNHFVTMVFEKAELKTGGKISLEDAKKEIIDKPLLDELLRMRQTVES